MTAQFFKKAARRHVLVGGGRTENHEKDIEKKIEYQKEKKTRVQEEDVHPRRPRGASKKEKKGQKSIDCMSGNSFGKSCRLINTFEFRRVRENGASFRDKTFAIVVLKNGAASHRLGLSISSSAVRLAARRNRLKRVIREVFRTNKSRIKDGPYDIVFYVKRPLAGDFDYDSARNSFLALMEKAKMLCKNI